MTEWYHGHRSSQTLYHKEDTSYFYCSPFLRCTFCRKHEDKSSGPQISPGLGNSCTGSSVCSPRVTSWGVPFLTFTKSHWISPLTCCIRTSTSISIHWSSWSPYLFIGITFFWVSSTSSIPAGRETYPLFSSPAPKSKFSNYAQPLVWVS